MHQYIKKKKFSKEEELFFLSRKKKYKKSDGKIIGYHQGASYFTKGQRKGIALGGYKEALFVIDTNVKENIVYTGMGKFHPGLYRKSLFIQEKNIHWIRKDLTIFEGEKWTCFVESVTDNHYKNQNCIKQKKECLLSLIICNVLLRKDNSPFGILEKN